MIIFYTQNKIKNGCFNIKEKTYYTISFNNKNLEESFLIMEKQGLIKILKNSKNIYKEIDVILHKDYTMKEIIFNKKII